MLEFYDSVTGYDSIILFLLRHKNYFAVPGERFCQVFRKYPQQSYTQELVLGKKETHIQMELKM